ncbi:HNH endonuclease [Nonomuraea bangladeshensis]|uniref:HNH endonuclease n=1 Tax=Nonomuraea bangladeshensis TaxID=404385 RepID=A0ABV3H972_9ACTN
MIRAHRTSLDAETALKLLKRTDRLKKAGAGPESARRSWRGAHAEKEQLRSALRRMSAAIERCMYCGDSRGTDIDHFEPIKSAPLRTFDWMNHLLACSSCNSNSKREAYPVDDAGTPLLIDPTVEDPFEHLRLILSTGTYRWTTPKGQATIEVFQLNRADLRRGRELAFPRCQAMLRDYRRLRGAGSGPDATTMLNALHEQPFADVLHAMYRTMTAPGADIVLGGSEVLEALHLAATTQRL